MANFTNPNVRDGVTQREADQSTAAVAVGGGNTIRETVERARSVDPTTSV